jgi:hypothetical protein
MEDYFRSSPIIDDCPFDAEHPVFRNISDCGFVTLPDDSSEGLIGIRLVEIYEGRTSLGTGRRVRPGDFPAYGSLFTYVFARFGCWNVLSGCES